MSMLKTKVCACGCGQKIISKPSHKYNGVPNYICGHNRRLPVKVKKENIKQCHKKYYDKLKNDAYKAYGGYRCACCGETEPLFLTIDHINEDGAVHRKTLGGRNMGARTFYKWLRDNNYPNNFQILCMNCNWGKHYNNGVCPHEGIFTN